MEYYAGIDASLEQSSVCIVDAKSKIFREAKVASEPGALIRWLKSQGSAWRGSDFKPGRCPNGFMRR
jgi:hypothetical protein